MMPQLFTKLVITATSLGITVVIVTAPAYAGTLTINPNGSLYLESTSQVLGATTKSNTKAVEFKATQENKIRVSTQPTDKKAPTPIAEEDEVVFTQKVATAEAKVRITSRDQNKYMITDGYMVKVGTPLSFNLETNEMIVTTPAGSKVVTVLPDAAYKNAKLTTTTSKDNMELIDYQNSPVYTVSGTANEKIFGLIPVTFDKKVFVSAISGNVVNSETSGLATILDLISF